jgi:hypothetical protein
MSEADLRVKVAELWGEDAAKAMIKGKPCRVPYRPMTWTYGGSEPSPNYCGYVNRNTSVYGAMGTFIAKHCTNGYSGAFVGIGGQTDLIQAGIDMVTMHAFVQQVSTGDAQYVDIGTGPNGTCNEWDVISVSAARYAGNIWYVVIYNATSRMSYGIYYTYTAERWATCILERQGGYVHGKWGSLTYSNCKWLDSGGSQYSMTSGNYYYQKYMRYLVNGSYVYLYPSSISNNSFSVTSN